MFFTDVVPCIMKGNTLRIFSPFHYWNITTIPSANWEQRMNSWKVWRIRSIVNWLKLEQRPFSWESNWHFFALRWHKAACQWIRPKTLSSLTLQRKIFGNVTRRLVPRREKKIRELTLNAYEKLPTEFKPVEVSFSHNLFFTFLHFFGHSFLSSFIYSFVHLFIHSS